mmetsp:Transcript_133898/g.232371  ORF Transcript_133898/g.232371 Transcript_133898/m.232371 type:complete len:331 (+) Transcript_133898:1401-2393(+)
MHGAHQKQLITQAVLEHHVTISWQANEGTQEVGDGAMLLHESIDHRSATRYHRGLQHIREDGQHRPEWLPLLRALTLVLHSHHQLRKDHQVNHQRGSQERVLTRVVDDECVCAAHEDAAGVLVHSPLAVPDKRHVLNHHKVVWVLTLLVQYLVGCHHVVHNIALGDFFAAEGLGCLQILAVVVTQMIIAGNTFHLDASTDQEIHQHGLQFCLTRLEIIAPNVHTVTLRQFLDTWHEGVLWGPIDVRYSFQYGGYSKDLARGHFLIIDLDGVQDLISSHVQSRSHISESFRVCRPENNNSVQIICLLEIPDVLSDLCQVISSGAIENVISS